MPICDHCGYRWRRRDVWRKLSVQARGTCPSCGTMQYVTATSRKRGSMYMLLVFLILIAQALFDLPLLWSITMLFALFFILMIFVIPRVYKLTSEQEALY
ncbi:TIGR04104 family putative zinc finger protein [Salimicrobium jeotgali]|uniref:TIGR04104 family putative zinc finger protein n=1 Tax=Salimicrobium jeotgali TaxID=1230341 RepID=UPI00093BE58F|nr:TIGR04104 family putative zinc finger protein [Salimicrobium jeotgali]MBM7696702.1 CXXC-20-CXXC protein [Salimicrobium jeotgali]